MIGCIGVVDTKALVFGRGHGYNVGDSRWQEGHAAEGRVEEVAGLVVQGTRCVGLDSSDRSGLAFLNVGGVLSALADVEAGSAVEDYVIVVEWVRW